MEQQTSPTSVALIVGVTGMVGLSLVESLNKPTTPGFPWKIYGVAKRPKPDWFPSSTIHQFISFDALNNHETHLHLSPLSNQITHLFWVALQQGENEETNISINSTMLSNVLNALKGTSTTNPIKLQHICLQTGTKHYMGPIFDPILGPRLVHHDPPFNEESPRLPYPNFYYALEDLVSSYSSKMTSFSVHRASIIIGASSRSLYNCLLTLAVYATICKHQGLPFKYPGNKFTWEHFCDMSDSRVLAEQQIWASFSDKAKNQAFNCTNGDFFTWKRMWEVLCEVFGVEFVGFDGEEFDVVEMMKDKGRVWDEIVDKYGLYKTKLEEITCFEAVKMVLRFELQHVSSMNKSRDFGFFGYADTLKSINLWVGRLRDMKIIP